MNNPDEGQKNLFESSKKVEEVVKEITSEAKSNKDLVGNLNCQKSICSSFAVSEKNIRTSSKGLEYIALTLIDKTGQIDGRIFSEDSVKEIYETIDEGSICKLEGKVNEFPPNSGKFNVVIEYIVKLSPDEYILEDYIRTSNNDKNELIEYVNSTIKDMENPELKNLLNSFFNDDEFTKEFYTAPAAKIHHHNYVGGLLDHTVEVLKISKTIYHLFPEIDKDLLYTGALLHDIGKIRAYDYDNLTIKMSERGKLLDHLYLSGVMVEERLEEVKISKELSNQLLHVILSHHGDVKLGWGSIVDPKTPVAVALHYADLMDARVKDMIK